MGQARWDRRPACPEMTGKMKLSQNSEPRRDRATLLVPRLWECMSWRLRLHYHAELHLVTGQSPEDTDSQAEPGNQEKWALRFVGALREPTEIRALLEAHPTQESFCSRVLRQSQMPVPS